MKRLHADDDALALARGVGRTLWGHARLWLDGGDGDHFRAGTDAFATALGIRARHAPGEHDSDYWHPRYAQYLRFYASALAAC